MIYLRRYGQVKFKDTKLVIRSRKSKKDRQYIGKGKRTYITNNDLQNTTQNTKAWETRTPLRTRVKPGCYGMISSSCFTSDVHPITVKINDDCWIRN